MYIFWFLHQTTTNLLSRFLVEPLYIFWFLHQTTTCCWIWYSHFRLYIFWFLHQTTTTGWSFYARYRCISFDSYIKPQRFLLLPLRKSVVYLLIPTSNHNNRWIVMEVMLLYIFWFLHQTTTLPASSSPQKRCISFDSYIKPQQ